MPITFKNLVFLIAIAMTPFWAQASGTKCKMVTNDVDIVVGHGDRFATAQADAVQQCVERRIALYEQNRGDNLTEERHSNIIDSCLEQSCSVSK